MEKKETLKQQLIGFGILSAITGAITLFSGYKYSQAVKESTAIRETKKVTIEQLVEKPEEYHGKYLKITGYSYTNQPLTSPMKNIECIMHKSETWRIFDEMKTIKSSTKNRENTKNLNVNLINFDTRNQKKQKKKKSLNKRNGSKEKKL
jgi:hypothetical protein